MSDWERITALFGAARLLESDARRAFLDAACSSDDTLRAEVDRLLADSASDDGFLSEPAWTGELGQTLMTSGPRPGDVFNARYRIDANIASGGQALVYRATDEALSRAVIVKVMRGGWTLNGLLRSRFEREMLALSRIDHPGVVGVLDVGELADGRPFLVIQYVNGVSLREELQNGPLDPARAARLLRELGSILSAAHAAGVTHRDLKPENIMLQRFDDGNETVRLIDFGLSSVERAAIDQGAMTSVTVAGTIRYVAPEQFDGRHSFATDVYALALVAAEMVCGHPDSRALPERFGSRTRALLESGLAFRPEDRPTDVRGWCDQLASALVAGDQSWMRQYVWIAAASAAVLAAGAIVWSAPWRAPSHDDTKNAGVSISPSEVAGAATVQSLSGDWTITGILAVCGFMCGQPVGTVYHSTATLTQDTVTTFHGVYGNVPVQGTVSAGAVSFRYDGYRTSELTGRGDCVGMVSGGTMTLKCSEYLKADSGSEFQLNGTRMDTVVRK